MQQRTAPIGGAFQIQAKIQAILAHLQKDEFDAALKLCDRLLPLAPGSPQMHFFRANALDGLGRSREANEGYEKAVKLDRNFVPAWVNLSQNYRDQERFDKAIEAGKRAIALQPDLWQPHYSVGRAYFAEKHYRNATRYLEKAAALNPQAAEIHVALAGALREIKEFERARAQLEKAMALGHRSDHVYSHLASILHMLGEFETAEELLKEGRERHPESVGILITQTVAADSDALTPEALPQIDAMIAAEDSNDLQRSQLHFAASRILEKARRFDEAFAHLSRANILRKAYETYDVDEARKQLETMRSIFTREFFAEHTDFGHPSDRMIFIVGMPRSGTTLTETIFASHPDVEPAGESGILRHIRLGTKRQAIAPANMREILAQMGPEESRAVGDVFLDTIARDLPPSARISEKTPAHFRLLGFFALIFPNATFVHCRRDPMDTCLSNFSQNFQHGNIPFSYDLDDLASEYRIYSRYMAHWRDVLPVSLLELDYENMIADPEYWSRALIAHAGLEWNDACLAFHQTKRTVQTASVWQVRQPIYKTSVAKWKRYEAGLAPLIEQLADLTEEHGRRIGRTADPATQM